jgi:acyl-CoA synthetase (AMP-forming)/AMP-acid ligase II
MEFNLADLYECVAGAVPDRVAVVAGERRRTYAELVARTTALAHGLAAAGVAPGEHVGLCQRNTVEHLEAMLACYQLRAVPINVNWRYGASELADLFADADTVLVLHDAEFGDAVLAAARQVPGVRATRVADADGLDRLVAARRGPERPLGPRSAEDRYVLYTGGTTGRPKGVVWRQEDIFFAALGGGNPGGPPIARPEEIGENVVANPAQRLRPFLGPGQEAPGRYVTFAMGPLMHASGSWGALGTILGGGTLVLDATAHLDPVRVLDLVQRERVGQLTLVGDAGGRPLVEAVEAQPARWDTSSLLVLGSGGSMLSADVKERLLAAFPTVLAILEGMGSSESPAQAVAVSTRAGGVAPSLTFAPKAETIVVDDDLVPVEPGRGIVGRLATRGRVPLGYHKDPERSARTFVTIDGARYSLPGDRAVVDADGTVHLVGRGATCINTGGEKVYPEEVEAAVLTHPRVRDAIVVGIPDERFGAAVAVVVACDGAAVTVEELREHCRADLAGYKHPRSVTVVDTVRRSAAGKADHAWAVEVASG